jgi:hypothetical protein
MQALEKIGVLEQDEDKGGRRITQSGQRDLDRKRWTVYENKRILLTRYRYCPDHHRGRGGGVNVFALKDLGIRFLHAGLYGVFKKNELELLTHSHTHTHTHMIPLHLFLLYASVTGDITWVFLSPPCLPCLAIPCQCRSKLEMIASDHLRNTRSRDQTMTLTLVLTKLCLDIALATITAIDFDRERYNR